LEYLELCEQEKRVAEEQRESASQSEATLLALQQKVALAEGKATGLQEAWSGEKEELQVALANARLEVEANHATQRDLQAELTRSKEAETTAKIEAQKFFESVSKLSMELTTAKCGKNLVAQTPRSAMNEVVEHMSSQLQTTNIELTNLREEKAKVDESLVELQKQLVDAQTSAAPDPRLQKALARITELEAVIVKAKTWRQKQLQKMEHAAKEIQLRDVEIQRLHQQLGLGTVSPFGPGPIGPLRQPDDDEVSVSSNFSVMNSSQQPQQQPGGAAGAPQSLKPPRAAGRRPSDAMMPTGAVMMPDPPATMPSNSMFSMDPPMGGSNALMDPSMLQPGPATSPLSSGVVAPTPSPVSGVAAPISLDPLSNFAASGGPAPIGTEQPAQTAESTSNISPTSPVQIDVWGGLGFSPEKEPEPPAAPPAAKAPRINFEKGQRAKYMHPVTGECVVKIVKIHYDDDPPYYTILMSNGNEKQTVHEKLTWMEQPPPTPRKPPTPRGNTDGPFGMPGPFGTPRVRNSPRVPVHALPEDNPFASDFRPPSSRPFSARANAAEKETKDLDDSNPSPFGNVPEADSPFGDAPAALGSKTPGRSPRKSARRHHETSEDNEFAGL